MTVSEAVRSRRCSTPTCTNGQFTKGVCRSCYNKAHGQLESTKKSRSARWFANREVYLAKQAEYVRNNRARKYALNARRRALKKNAPGHSTPEDWLALLEAYGGRCRRCASDSRITIDHIRPLSKGGSNSIDNLQPLCVHCNSKKRNKLDD